MHEAFFYIQDKGAVICSLCAQRCRIELGRKGRCGVRQNVEGKLYSLVYGELIAEHVDPIEKKPLFHVLPGSLSFSIATMGCNFRCRHCQNSSISQVSGKDDAELVGRKTTPSQVVANARQYGCRTISYTYVEPTVFYEFAYDCAVEAVENGIRNVFVSNGYLSEEATRHIAPYLAAINIDIKAFSEEFYRKICGAKLEPVLRCVRLMKELGVWVEVTTLLIPGLNDSDAELAGIAAFLVALDADIPWHVTAFHPTYKMMDRPPTPPESLARARQIGLDAGLAFVYEGNVAKTGGENTSCPACSATVVERFGFSIRKNRLADGRCPQCSTLLPGIWE